MGNRRPENAAPSSPVSIDRWRFLRSTSDEHVDAEMTRQLDRSIDEEQWALAIWAQDSIKKGRLKQIVDTNIRGSVSPKCLKLLAQLAKGCLHKHLKQRPTMAEVVVCLESILALQEKANNTSQLTIMQNISRFAPTVVSPSNVENSGGSSGNSLALYLDTVGGENQTLRRFDLDTLIVATKNFSEANKISPHKCESLYKGKLQNGLSIAVTSSGTQREEEYMNEASILVKLEHENVAKLLGYCIEGKTWFLVYEFAVLESLDHLMFDPACTLLDWDTRYKIVLGVAKALLYLHKDAPVRVIHCDVKPQNILLDESLNAKLSSFWNARCLAINETDCHPSRFCGTLIDVDSSSMTSFVEIGLLCVQKDAADRPTMVEVVSMLLDRSSLAHLVAKMRKKIPTKRERSNGISSAVNDNDSHDGYYTGADEDEFLSELVPR
ncbi:hypothetical protein E3N88_41047 [Mikania micrantha]|uniref:non-specific serine/threonine protein kinase n=1 Tax=Mikania micrantha TaxID=192012 RepID=A0A5N6LPA1_9ASTR|nr:hypothetical protein E3N88_41047 [Mikania micrantha]